MDLQSLVMNGASVSVMIGLNDLREFADYVLASFAERQAKEKEEAETKKSNEFITNKQFLKMLGISVATGWRWERDGLIKPVYFGSKKMFRRSDVQKLIEGRA